MKRLYITNLRLKSGQIIPSPLVIILLFALSLRLIYFLQISYSPGISQHVWPETDMNFFDQWAKQISAGDYLSKEVGHPHQPWNESIAPKQQWDRWFGGKIFHQEPLYAYLIALTYRLIGVDVRIVFFWQMLLGLLSIVLIYYISSRHFGPRVAILSAAIAGGFGPSLYYEAILLRETMIIFFGLLLIDTYDRVHKKESLRGWALLGFLCGLAILLKSTFLLFWIGTILAISWLCRHKPIAGLKIGGVLTVGLVTALLPLVLRNISVGVPALSMSSVGAITFINTNASDYRYPEFGFFISSFAASVMAKTDGHFLPAVIETLRTHESFASYLNLLWSKFSLIWHWFEIPNNTNFYYYRLHAPVLHVMLTWWLLAPLALLGAFLALRNKRLPFAWSLLIAMSIITILGFNVISRLRLALVVMMLPMAAFCMVEMYDMVKARQYKRFSCLAIILLVLMIWTSRPLLSGQHLINSSDYYIGYQTFYVPKIREAIYQKNWDGAIEVINESLLVAPREITDPLYKAEHPMNNQLKSFYASLFFNRAIALKNLGRAEEALQDERRCEALAISITR